MKTLKNSFLLLALLCCSSAAMAQLGVRAGINLANVDFDIDDSPVDIETDVRVGFQVAAFYEAALSDNFSLQPELTFIQKGFKIEDTGDDLTRTLNYLEVPVLGKYNFNEGEVLFFLQGGPSFGFALSGEDKLGNQSEDIDFEEDDVTRFDFGLQLGGGLGFPVGDGTLFFDARYLLGLTNGNENDDPTVFNRGIGLSIGYKFMMNN